MSEPRPFAPVSDLQLLAAIDRAERHRRAAGVQRRSIADHLGFARGAFTTRKLDPQIERLIAAGHLVRSRRAGNRVWGLTAQGRRKLARARREGKNVELPEAPQHQTWREARDEASLRIGEFRVELGGTLAEAQALLERVDQSQSASTWSELSGRLRRQCAQLSWALHCLHEWDEPEDDRVDIGVGRRLAALHLTTTDLTAVLPRRIPST